MESTYDFFSHGGKAGAWAPMAERGVTAEYERGRFIYMQDQRPDHFYYLARGRVRSFMSAETGEQRLLTVYGEGDIFGEASFFDGLPRVSSAVALTDCRVVAIDREALVPCFAAHPDLAVQLLHYLAGTVRLLSEHVDRSFRQVPERLGDYLLRLCRGMPMTIHCSHEELGAAIGASRVSVSRALGRFIQSGWIETGYRTITVLDPAAILRFSQEQL